MFVNDYSLGLNFWEANPQLAHYPPFSSLYKRDKSKGKTSSSNEMWGVFFYCENSDRSRFYRMNEELRKENISKEFTIDFSDELVQECITQYPIQAMTAIEVALKQYEDWLIKRTDFITKQKYTFDYIDDDGIHKGNTEQLDKMAAQSKKIWDDYIAIKKQFDEEKGKGRLRGGRKLSASEQGLL